MRVLCGPGMSDKNKLAWRPKRSSRTWLCRSAQEHARINIIHVPGVYYGLIQPKKGQEPEPEQVQPRFRTPPRWIKIGAFQIYVEQECMCKIDQDILLGRFVSFSRLRFGSLLQSTITYTFLVQSPRQFRQLFLSTIQLRSIRHIKARLRPCIEGDQFLA